MKKVVVQAGAHRWQVAILVNFASSVATGPMKMEPALWPARWISMSGFAANRDLSAWITIRAPPWGLVVAALAFSVISAHWALPLA